MDILTMNALGITVMAIFGLWVFYKAAQSTKKRRPPHDDDHKDQ